MSGADWANATALFNIARMLRHLISGLLAIGSVALISGCTPQTPPDTRVAMGTHITDVQAQFGLPDLIVDHMNGFCRAYTPKDRPATEWPADVPRTFYYLDRDMEVSFVRGEATAVSHLSPDERQVIAGQLNPGGHHAAQ
jgi:hypothetical protein